MTAIRSHRLVVIATVQIGPSVTWPRMSSRLQPLPCCCGYWLISAHVTSVASTIKPATQSFVGTATGQIAKKNNFLGNSNQSFVMLVQAEVANSTTSCTNTSYLVTASGPNQAEIVQMTLTQLFQLFDRVWGCLHELQVGCQSGFVHQPRFIKTFRSHGPELPAI